MHLIKQSNVVLFVLTKEPHISCLNCKGDNMSIFSFQFPCDQNINQYNLKSKNNEYIKEDERLLISVNEEKEVAAPSI